MCNLLSIAIIWIWFYNVYLDTSPGFDEKFADAIQLLPRSIQGNKRPHLNNYLLVVVLAYFNSTWKTWQCWKHCVRDFTAHTTQPSELMLRTCSSSSFRIPTSFRSWNTYLKMQKIHMLFILLVQACWSMSLIIILLRSYSFKFVIFFPIWLFCTLIAFDIILLLRLLSLFPYFRLQFLLFFARQLWIWFNSPPYGWHKIYATKSKETCSLCCEINLWVERLWVISFTLNDMKFED